MKREALEAGQRGIVLLLASAYKIASQSILSAVGLSSRRDVKDGEGLEVRRGRDELEGHLGKAKTRAVVCVDGGGNPNPPAISVRTIARAMELWHLGILT